MRLLSSADPSSSSCPRAFMALHSFLLLFFCLLLCFGGLPTDAQITPRDPALPKGEIDALKAIDSKLRVGWDFSFNPCAGAGGWLDSTAKTPNRNLTCSCNVTSGVCNVVSILLKSQNLTGVLPADFANLTSLVQIDLTRNYINGTIPPEWGSLPLLVNISLLGNRISGSIPLEIGNIITLESLVLENNLIQGHVPAELGRLVNLKRMFLCGNDFVGQLPDSLGNLKNLTDFRIDGTGISGKIPSFIGNWTNLNRLDMQGTSLEGPFPSTFTELRNLVEMRITDLKGGGKFPNLKNQNLRYLILRNCSISDTVPDYIAEMTLRILDLSFNNFTGPIPGSFEKFGSLKDIDHVYFTNNMLTGPIPNWILSFKSFLDASYNHFDDSSGPTNCQQGNVNFVASHLSSQNNGIKPCFKKNYPCPGKARNYNLFINCGGMKVNIGDNVYEEDSSQIGASTFYESQKWALSSTGDFLGKSNAEYLARNITALNTSNTELYMTARLNPSSLKYYGLCLQKGNYTVGLHFAEIMFTDDQTFLSVGRRFFDVSIQGKKVLRNFNIVEAANGTGRAIIKNFTTIVEGSTLEIHFQWAGKGTNSIPDKGVYGPLISAISVTPNFTPDIPHTLPLAAIIGIAIAAFVVFSSIILFLWLYVKRRHQGDSDLEDLQVGHINFSQIKTATRNFHHDYFLGGGGFGPVYKGVLPNGTLIAVKRLKSMSAQGKQQFINEVGVISALQHPNLVKLLGCCVERAELVLIYEFMENNSLGRALFGPEEKRLMLDFRTRRNICIEIARGLAYLHEESSLKIVHRDIKSDNILLDRDFHAKISDFGLAKLHEDDTSKMTTNVAGTTGYMAPEYVMWGQLTEKIDVFGFGIIMLEVVTGKSIKSSGPSKESKDPRSLYDVAQSLKGKGKLIDLVDPILGSDYSREEAEQMLRLALMCANQSPTFRPTMTAVVSMLEGNMPVQTPTASDSEGEEAAFETIQKLTHDRHSLDGLSCPSHSTTVETSYSNIVTQYKENIPR